MLAGRNDGLVAYAYSTGDAGTAGSPAGGLVSANSRAGVIEESFATGNVFNISLPLLIGAGIATDNMGRIANNVYRDVDTTHSPNGAYGLPAPNGLTAAQMGTPASFVSWDFSPTGTWAMPAGATHPVLSWQLAH